jgi:chemotaxis protein methyltransferase WspC
MKGDTAVAEVLAERIGLDPSTVGDGLLARALHARMSALGLRHQADYVRLLRDSRDEQDALIEEVVISESWFFRDEAPFRLFWDHVRAHWLFKPTRPRLRVLSIPCAGGEEPYSIAIAFRELGLPPERGMIDAVDVSRRSLDRAARGIYGEHAFRGMDPEHRARYFRAHPKGYELDPAIRASVRFQRGNLLDPHLLRDEPSYDVILCRNLLIYLDFASRRSALDTLDRLLARPGLLFLGHAERPEIGETRFEPVGEKGCFAYRHVEPGPISIAPHAPARREKAQTRSPIPSPLVEEGQGGGRKPTSKAIPFTPTLPHEGGGRNNDSDSESVKANAPSPLLDEAAALADQGKNSEAAERCERFLRESGPSAPAYFLLGMIRQAEGDARRAEECWQKTVYLDPQHDEALLVLALIAGRRGDQAAAAGYRRRADRVRQRREKP